MSDEFIRDLANITQAGVANTLSAQLHGKKNYANLAAGRSVMRNHVGTENFNDDGTTIANNTIDEQTDKAKRGLGWMGADTRAAMQAQLAADSKALDDKLKVSDMARQDLMQRAKYLRDLENMNNEIDYQNATKQEAVSKEFNDEEFAAKDAQNRQTSEQLSSYLNMLNAKQRADIDRLDEIDQMAAQSRISALDSQLRSGQMTQANYDSEVQKLIKEAQDNMLKRQRERQYMPSRFVK